MTIDSEGWLDWAQREPGPPAKEYAGLNTLELIVGHSMEGWWLTGGRSQLMNPKAGSWHATILVGGQVLQHYTAFDCPWASGNVNANTRGFAIELEGMAGQPATGEQIKSAKRIRADLEAFEGRTYRYEAAPSGGYTAPLPSMLPPDGRFVQHNEVETWVTPNAGPTACPSGRWAFFTEETTEDEVTKKEYEDLCLAVFAGSEEKDEWGNVRPRQERLDLALFRLMTAAEGSAPSVREAGIANGPGGLTAGTPFSAVIT